MCSFSPRSQTPECWTHQGWTQSSRFYSLHDAAPFSGPHQSQQRCTYDESTHHNEKVVYTYSVHHFSQLKYMGFAFYSTKGLFLRSPVVCNVCWCKSPLFPPAVLSTYLPDYLLTYLPTYLLTYLHTYLPTYLLTYLHTYPPTYLLTYLHTYLPTYLPSCLPTYLPTHPSIHSCIHPSSINLSVCPLVYLPACLSLTSKKKLPFCSSFIIQNTRFAKQKLH